MKSRMAEYTLPLQQERERICNSGIFLSRNCEIPLPEGRYLADSGIWKMVQTATGQTVYRTLPGFPDIVSARMDFSDCRTDIKFFSMEEEDAYLREINYTGQAFGQLALQQNRMVLHGSCIARNGRGVVFSAPSGTGKSTHTGLWKQYYPDTEYVNDDTPVLRLDRPGEVLACGSPWSGKTQLNSNISVPLSAVVFLERGTENSIAPLSKTEALGRLLGECRKIPFQSTMQKAAELCGRLLERVPVYRLSCNISYEAVETVRKELLL